MITDMPPSYLPAPKIQPNTDSVFPVPPRSLPINGRVMDAMPEQPENAPVSISVTLSGTVTSIRLVQSLNAYWHIFSILPGITSVDGKPVQPLNICPDSMLICEGIARLLTPEQFLNAHPSIWVTVSG